MTSTSPTRREIRDSLADPVSFATTWLGHDVWDIPAQIMRSVYARPGSRTGVKSCHASSKTFTAGEIVLHWVMHDKRAVAVTTAPTWKQVSLTLWGEIGKGIASSRVAFPEPGRAQLWLDRAGIDGAAFDNYAIGISTNESSRFQGLPRLKLLIVVDEGAGVKPQIYEAIEGIRAAGDVRVLVLGNPTIVGGPYYEIFHKNRERYSTFTIDALDTPNLRGLGRTVEERLERLMHAYTVGDESVIEHVERSYLITRRYVAEKFLEWGVNSPQWWARIRGQFWQFGNTAVYPLAYLERSQNQPVPDPDIVRDSRDDVYDVGIDPAGPGRAATGVCLIHRPDKRPHIHSIHGIHDADARGPVMQILNPLRRKIRRVKVDATGEGWYFAQHLRDQGFDVYEINWSDSPVFDFEERFTNRKAEAYWNTRDHFINDEITGLAHEKALQQLAGILWRPDSRGRIMIEPKEEALAKRGEPSPDEAESLILALAPVRPHETDTSPPTTARRSM